MTSEEVQAIADELRQLIENEPIDYYMDRKAKRDHYRIVELRRDLAQSFAERNGWQWSPRSFMLECLQRGTKAGGRTPACEYNILDHVYYFRDLEGRAVGICSNVYDQPSPEGLQELCTRFDLAWEECLGYPSFYFPDHTLMYLFTRRQA